MVIYFYLTHRLNPNIQSEFGSNGNEGIQKCSRTTKCSLVSYPEPLLRGDLTTLQRYRRHILRPCSTKLLRRVLGRFKRRGSRLFLLVGPSDSYFILVDPHCYSMFKKSYRIFKIKSYEELYKTLFIKIF